MFTNQAGPGADDVGVGILDEILLGMVVAGRGRRRRPRRPPSPVVATPWLEVGAAAVAAQMAVLVAALAWLGYWAWVLSTDDLLFVLGLVVAPLALAGLGLGGSALLWMGAVARRLRSRDGTARVELGALGVGGLLVGGSLLAVALVVPAVVVAVPSLAATVVSVASEAWNPVPPAGPEDLPAGG